MVFLEKPLVIRKARHLCVEAAVTRRHQEVVSGGGALLHHPGCHSGHHVGAALIPGLSLGSGAPLGDPRLSPLWGRASGTAWCWVLPRSLGPAAGSCDLGPGDASAGICELRQQAGAFQEEPGPPPLRRLASSFPKVLTKRIWAYELAAGPFGVLLVLLALLGATSSC